MIEVSAQNISETSAEPLRILYVESSLDGTVGGSHISLLHLVAGVKQLGYEPVVVFSACHSLLNRFDELGITIHIMPSRKPWKSNNHLLAPFVRIMNSIVSRLASVVSIVRFFVLLGKERIALVHMNNSVFDSALGWLVAAKLRGIPCVAHERGLPVGCPALIRFTIHHYAAIICISHAVRRSMLALNLGRLKLLTIHNGIDVTKSQATRTATEIREEFGIASARPIVGIVGNIQPWKGQDVVIRAIALLRKEVPDIVCLIVGDVSKSFQLDVAYLESLQRLIADQKLDANVIMTGYRRDVANYMNAMDVVIHSSIKPEPFGRVLLEAMSVRKPLVAAAAGGVPEIVVDGTTGFLFTPGNSTELAACLCDLLGDASKRTLMGNNGYDRVVSEFNTNKTTDAISEVYRSVLT